MLRPSAMTALQIATSSSLSGSDCTKERSIFNVSIEKRRMYDSDECPVPKSSIASRTPMRRKLSSIARVASLSSISSDSVSSISSRCGSISFWRSESSISDTR
jgi:hypothetical protein